jgi:hypothetical protein
VFDGEEIKLSKVERENLAIKVKRKEERLINHQK